MKSRKHLVNLNASRLDSAARIIHGSSAGIVLRLSVVMILACVLVSSFFISSSASKAVPTQSNNAAEVTQNAEPPTLGTLQMAEHRSVAPLMAFKPVLAPVPPAGESVETFAADCTTPKGSFAIGDTVCVKLSGFPVGSSFPRRLLLANANSTIIQSVDITTDPQTFSFVVTASSVIGGVTVDNRGSWVALVLNPFFYYPEGATGFTVADPSNLTADAGISTTSSPGGVQEGTAITFELQLKNYGPDSATTVQLTDAVPANTTFVDFQQTSGPTFTCVNPGVGSMGTTTCSIASLDWPGPAAIFIATYQVNSGTPANTAIVNTANISSPTNDQNLLNNSTSDTATVVAPEGTACSFTCPENMVVTATSPSGAVVSFASAVNVDGDCGAISATPSSGSQFPVGVTTVNVSSGSGPACSFTVKVVNTPAPTISCPADVVVTDTDTSGFETVAVGAPSTTPTSGVTVAGRRSDDIPATYDENGNVLTPEVIVPLTDPYPIGTTGITWIVTDSDGRMATCTQRIVVIAGDARPAVTITCPANVTAAAPSGSCEATISAATIGTPTTNPSDGDVAVSAQRSDGQALSDPFPAGATTITWTAHDNLTNTSASCTQTVTVTVSGSDTTPPTFVAPLPPNLSVTTSTCTATLDDELGTAQATDSGGGSCSGAVTITRTGVPANFVFPTGTTIVTYTATDASGNTATHLQTVTVTESPAIPPTITAPASVSVNTGPGATICGTVVSDAVLGTATANDNCSGVTVTRSGVPAGNLFPVGNTIVTYTATDKSGNTASATQTVTVVDNTAPVVTAPAAKTLFTGPGATSCGVTVSNLDTTLGTGSATDNCPGVGAVTRSGVPAGNVFPVGNTVVTYSATDAHGNTSSANQTVTVVDNTLPVITCQANIVADYDPVANGAVVTYTAPVGTDNCASNTAQIAGLPSGSTFPTGTTTNTFRVTDASGNTAECSFKVTVALTSLIGLDSITMTGSGYADSYSSAGGYPATKGSLANLLSNGTITMGNSSKVWGNVRSTRANVNMTGASVVTGNAIAGTTVTTSGSAVVLGTRTNNALGAVMTLPAVPACSPFSSGSGISGTYTYSASTGDLTLSGVNIATLANGNYCFHNVTVGNSAQLKVNGPVVIKLTGTLNTSGASSLNNTTQIPSNLRILSSYSGTNGIVLGNSTAVYALVYAPKTGLNLSGAAPLFGTFAGKALTIGNSGAIHYDTQLKNVWPDIWTLIF